MTTFNDEIKQLMQPPFHLHREKILSTVRNAKIYLEEIELDGTVATCHSILYQIREHVEILGERGPDFPNLGCEILTLLDRAYTSVARLQNRPVNFYGAGVRILTVWDKPYSSRRGAGPRTLLGIMVYKMGDLDPEFEPECNPITDSDRDKAYLYYVVTRQDSIRGLGKSMMLLFLSLTDMAEMDSILNLAVDTPASFYEQFGYSFGPSSKTRMSRPWAREPVSACLKVAKEEATEGDAEAAVVAGTADAKVEQEVDVGTRVESTVEALAEANLGIAEDAKEPIAEPQPVPRLQSESPRPRVSTQKATPTRTCDISPTRLGGSRGDIVVQAVMGERVNTTTPTEKLNRKRGRRRYDGASDWNDAMDLLYSNPKAQSPVDAAAAAAAAAALLTGTSKIKPLAAICPGLRKQTKALCSYVPRILFQRRNSTAVQETEPRSKRQRK